MRFTLTAFLCAAVLVPPVRASAVSPGAVVAEVYGGGGNAHAAYARDFVELFNRSKTAIDLTRWRVQYAPKGSDRWVSTPLAGQIAPYRYYLIALGGGPSGGAALPAPDASGSTNLSGAAGSVRLLDGAGAVADLVGYGTATTSERRPAPASADATKAVTRKRGGCMDTDDNSTDFEVLPVKPRNHSAAFTRCDSAPELNTIGNRAVHAGSSLTFTLSAYDPDGDALTYTASNLPAGSTFYPDSRTFSWRPLDADVGTYAGARFAVSDGFSTDDETITIGVAPRSDPGPSTTSVVFTKTDTDLAVHGTVSPDHRGFEVAVRLFRKDGPGWQLVSQQRPVLDANSTYRASFARAAPGTCMLRAKFAGDELHKGSVGAVQFRC
jgi:hypothetical protein